MTDTSLKRFDPYSEHAGDELGQMQENDYGDYYNREDVDAKLAKQAAEIERLRDVLGNLMIGIGMGWDLEAMVDAAQKELDKHHDD